MVMWCEIHESHIGICTVMWGKEVWLYLCYKTWVNAVHRTRKWVVNQFCINILFYEWYEMGYNQWVCIYNFVVMTTVWYFLFYHFISSLCDFVVLITLNMSLYFTSCYDTLPYVTLLFWLPFLNMSLYFTSCYDTLP